MIQFIRSIALAAAVLIAGAQTGLAQDQAPATPTADPADVASLDAIMAAVYNVISGPAGAPRDWDRFRSLFAPGARLIPVGGGVDAPARAAVSDVDGYVARASSAFETQAFYEVEIARTVERYGPIAHAFSTYEARREPEGVPFVRGINSFQLLNDGERWWVVTIYWRAETEANPIPERYLP
ncbi:MAG: hypothetical protein ACFB2Z_13830 [Maricaulaceae bacterium]